MSTVTARAQGATRGLEMRNETVQVLICNSLGRLKGEGTGGWKAAGYGDENCLRRQTRGMKSTISIGERHPYAFCPVPAPVRPNSPGSLQFPVPAFEAGTGQVNRQCLLPSLDVSLPNKTHQNFYTTAVKTLYMLSVDALLAFHKGGLAGVWNYPEPLRRNSWNTNSSRN